MKQISLIELEEVSSTNDYLKKLAAENEVFEGTVVLANFQKNGKGMGTNVWESEKGKNLTFSLFLHPKFLPAELMFLISKMVSLGIVNYLNTQTTGFSIKWPNDIYYHNSKIGGILIENQLLGNTLNNSFVGIGLNINQEVFISDAPNPISLKNIIGKPANTKICLNEIFKQIAYWYKVLRSGDYQKITNTYFSLLYRNSDYHNYSCDEGVFSAKIISVENDGQLVLCTPENKTLTFYFKELEFIL